MAQAIMKGTRLAFVVVPIEEPVKRRFFSMRPRGKSRDGKVLTHERIEEVREVEGGYMVYFPRGHAIRCKNKKELARYGLDRDPEIISLEGLHDPNSPIGKLVAAQDDATRGRAMQSLEMKVINTVTANGRRDILTKEAA